MTSAAQQLSIDTANTEAGYGSRARDSQAGDTDSRFDVRGANIDLDNALQLMAPEIREWLENSTQQLQEAMTAYIELGGRAPRPLLHLLQDLRGQAGSIGFPLASRVAAALYRLLEADKSAPVDVLVSHIDAIKAIILENARGTENPLAMSLVQALEEFGEIWICGESGKNSESSCDG